MRNVSIKTKLILLAAFMSAVLVGVGWLGLSGMKNARASLETVYQERLVAAIQLAAIGELLSDTRREMLVSVLYGRSNFSNVPRQDGVTDREHHAARIEANTAEIDKTWREYMASYLTPEEKVLGGSALSTYTALVEKGIKPGIALLRDNDMKGLDAHVKNIMLPLDGKSHEAIQALIRLQDRVARAELARSASDYRIRFTASVIGIALAVLAGIVTGVLTIRSVTGTADRLRESEQRYRTLFESANDALLIMSGTTIIDCNRKALEMFGGSREELSGISLSDISTDFQGEGKPTADEIGRRVNTSMEGRPQLFEWRHRRVDGSPFDAEVSLDRIELLGETVLLAIVRDITERKRAEKDLMDSERRFRTLFEQAAVGVAEIDPVSGRFLHVNRRYCEIAGFSLDEMLNRDFQSITYPDDLQDDLNNMEMLLAGEINEFSMEKRYVRKDGEIVWVNLTVYPAWYSDEEPNRHIAIVEDITERKNAENALRTSEEKFFKAFHATPNAILITRASDGLILEINESFCGQTGYSRDEALGRTTVELNFWADPHDRRRYVAEVQEHGMVREMEAEFRTKSGTILDGIVSGDCFLLDDEQWLLTIIRDVTEWKKADAELRKYRLHLEDLVNERTEELKAANQKLKDLDRLKSMFIASMSHELRTPLNSIIGFTGMTLQGLSGELNDEQKDNLSRSYHSAKHLLSLITDVIDISKIEAGRVESYPEAFTLREIIDEAVDTVRPQQREKRLGLIVEVPVDVELNADRKRLLQCLLNFLSNAVKFTESGTITVAGRETDGSVRISVRDTGIGIAEKDMPKLFEAFERLETHLRVKAGGTGLGLYLTRKIARDILHGDVSVKSREGEGSTFTLTVPKDMRQLTGTAGQPEKGETSDENSPDHRG
jgi:PAS domain S-box-containing protein